MIFLLSHSPPLFQEGVIMRVSFTMYDTTCERILNGSIGCCVCPVTSDNKKSSVVTNGGLFFLS